MIDCPIPDCPRSTETDDQMDAHMVIAHEPSAPQAGGARLLITIGLPASGKTTWARRQSGFRVNRDDLRAMSFKPWPPGSHLHEDAITAMQMESAGALLKMGFTVIGDDTNLNPFVVSRWVALANLHHAAFHIEDFTHVPVDECVRRDALRDEPVGEDVIRGMFDKYLNGWVISNGRH